MRKLLTTEVLDRSLKDAARNQDQYLQSLSALIDRTDTQDLDLEVADPQSWRRSSTATRTSFAQQFRADVDAIIPLTREEEARLARRIEFARVRLEKTRAEDIPSTSKKLSRQLGRRFMELHALRSEMVERNLYLVLINVERYAQSGASRPDLIQEGCASLFRAVDGFDWRRGLLFRTYAVHWLNQAFRNYLYNNTHTVRVPVYLQKTLKRINQASIHLADPNASIEELARTSALDPRLVSSALEAVRSNYSIDVQHSDGEDGVRLRDLLADPGAGDPYSPELEDVSLSKGIESAIKSLGGREELVLRMRFGLGFDREHTLSEVANKLNVSVERVRQIQVRALSKLDTPNLRRSLEPFLN